MTSLPSADASLEGQLVQAVDIASNPQQAAAQGNDPDLALRFLESLRASATQSWLPAWNVFAGDAYRVNVAARMFALNVVEEFLENRLSELTDASETMAFLQEASLTYIRTTFVLGDGEAGMAFIKNKAAQILTLIVLQTYALPVPSTFLPTLLSLLRAQQAGTSGAPSTSTSPPLNPQTTDLLLRVLHDLSLTLGSDVSLRAARTRQRLQRDATVRDEIRAQHAPALAQEIWAVLGECMAVLDSPQDSPQESGVRRLTKAAAADVAEYTTKVIKDYIPWIDISLTLTPATVGLLYQLLHHPTLPKLRLGACQALQELVAKGMKPADKLEVIRALDLVNVLGALEQRTRPDGKARQDSDEDDSRIIFRENVAKLINTLTLELVKILEEPPQPGGEHNALVAAADAALVETLPLLLVLLNDEMDECTESLLSGTTAWLGIEKKARKRGAPAGEPSLVSLKAGYLAQLLQVLISKSKYDSDTKWAGAGQVDDEEEQDSDAEEAEKQFADLRKSLQVLMLAVATIDETMFNTAIQSVILGTFDAFNAGAATPSGSDGALAGATTWQQAELSVYLLYIFGDITTSVQGGVKSGISIRSFVVLAPEDANKRGSRPKFPNSMYQTLPLSALGELVSRLVSSGISTYPHPAVQLQHLECLVRFASFFIARPDHAGRPDAFPAFLDARGIYNPRAPIRYRAQYLYYKFVKETRTVVGEDVVRTLLDGMQRALVVHAELPPAAPDEDVLVKAAEMATSFDSQLNLFETSGMLISQLTNEGEVQSSMLKAIVEPLTADLQRSVQSFQSAPNDVRQVLQAHHLMLALSNVAKGFPDAPMDDKLKGAPTENGQATATWNASGVTGPQEATPRWVFVFQTVTEQIVLALRALVNFSVVREAARGAFARIVSTTGKVALPYIPSLIDAMLSQVSETELADFLGFLSLVGRKYGQHVAGMMEELFLSVMERAFFFLNQDVAGTDDAVQRVELQRAYLQFLSAFVSSNLEGVLTTKKNSPQLETILQSLVYYATAPDVGCQRLAFGVLARLVTLWGRREAGAPSTNGGTGSGSVANAASGVAKEGKPLPGFERFIYETLVGLCFEAPAKPTFDLRDAQTQGVLSEIAGLLKSIHEARREELFAYLTEVYFPSIQCPPELAFAFAGAVRDEETKVLKKTLQGFVERSRGG